jgi:hypothetical protein
VFVADNRTQLIDRLAKNIHHAAQSSASDRYGDARAGVVSFHAANHSFGGLHGHSANAAFAEVLLYFDDDVERLGNILAFAGDANGVVDRRKVAGLKLNVQDWADDLDYVSYCCDFLCHAFSYFP